MPIYFSTLFGFGFVLSSCISALLGRRHGPGDIGRRALFGAMNIGTTAVIIVGLSRVPGSIFFPSLGVLSMVFTILLGVWVWRERPQAWGWFGFGLAGAAAILLPR